MRLLVVLYIVAILGPAASADEIFFSGTSGANFIFASLQENGSQLTLKTKASFAAPGSVGITALWERESGLLDMFFSYAKPSTNAPAYGRFSVQYDGNSFVARPVQLYPQVLGSFGNLGVFGVTTTSGQAARNPDLVKPILFRTQKSPKEDVFWFATNSSLNPFGAGHKFFDHPAGSILRSTSFSRDGEFAVSSAYDAGIGERFTITFGGEVGFPVIKDKLWFNVGSPVINVSASEVSDEAKAFFVFRDKKTTGRQNARAPKAGDTTSVFLGIFDLKTKSARSKRLSGPTTVPGGPGTYEYDVLFYNTVDISPNGKWIFYTKPGSGCGSAWEVWARRLSAAGGYAGAPFRPFGACNAALGDGSVRSIAVRSMDLWTKPPAN